MATSVDGRTVVGRRPNTVAAAVRREDELVHASYDAERRQGDVLWLRCCLAAANG